MKVCSISDIHNKIADIVFEPADVLIIAGDLTDFGTAAEISEANSIIKNLPFKEKIFVPGNHDMLFESHYALGASLLNSCTVLVDASVKINGVHFYGSPHCSRYGQWAFMGDDAYLKEKFSKIPDDVDVLITHNPPFGVLDLYNVESIGADGFVSKLGMRLGSEVLSQEMKRLTKIKVHCFGHIHDGQGKHEVNGIRYFNCAQCDSKNTINTKPHYFEV